MSFACNDQTALYYVQKWEINHNKHDETKKYNSQDKIETVYFQQFLCK